MAFYKMNLFSWTKTLSNFDIFIGSYDFSLAPKRKSPLLRALNRLRRGLCHWAAKPVEVREHGRQSRVIHS